VKKYKIVNADYNAELLQTTEIYRALEVQLYQGWRNVQPERSIAPRNEST
jgi:hypothetical protein